jgi:hypothetical protein
MRSKNFEQATASACQNSEYLTWLNNLLLAKTGNLWGHRARITPTKRKCPAVSVNEKFYGC